MDPEIEKYLKIALDSGVSSYYRKDAIRHLGRLRKSAELSNAVIKLLKDVDDPSLQREAMDLAAQFAISEAVNILLPISVGKGVNARNAINVLAKIGGVSAYKSLKEIASAPGFDLSKTAAKRALEDLLRREPSLEKEAEDDSSIVSAAKGVFEDIKEAVTGQEALEGERVPAVTPVVKADEKKPNNSELQRSFNNLQNKYNNLERKLAEKSAKVEELEQKIRDLKKNSKSAQELKATKKTLHDARNESASIKAAYEKQVALLKGKVISLEEENDDLLRRKSKVIHSKQSSNKGGCMVFIIFFAVIIFIFWFIGSRVFSSTSEIEQLKEHIDIHFKK